MAKQAAVQEKDSGSGDSAVAVKRVRLVLTPEDELAIDGQSEICNWLRNALLSRMKREYGRFCDIADALRFSGCIGDEADDLRRELPDISGRIFSRYGIRDMVPELKDSHPFLRMVHSSPAKNVALRLDAAFRQWRRRRSDGYGFPRFHSWSADYCSLLYDERKGWHAQGHDLHLSFGERVLPEAEMNAAQRRALERKRKGNPAAVLTQRLGVDVRLAEPAPTDAYRLEIVREGADRYAVFTRKATVRPPRPGVQGIVYLDPNHKNLVYALDDAGRAVEVANRVGLKADNRRIDHILSWRDRAERKAKKVEFARGDGTVHRHWEPSNAWFGRDRVLKREEAKRRGKNKTFVRTVLHRFFDGHGAVGLGDYVPEAKDHRLGGRKARGRRKANRSVNNCSLLGALQRALPQVAAKRRRLGYVMDERGTTRTCHACLHAVDGGIEPGIRAWICPGCGARHVRDENACQNGLARLSALLRADGSAGNPQCDAHAPPGGHCPPPAQPRGVAVSSRCDWTFGPDGSCRIAETPQAGVEKTLGSARQVGQGRGRVQKELRRGDAPRARTAKPAAAPHGARDQV